MSEFWMFASTVIGGGLFLLMAQPIDEALLRVGMWMNGIERKEADRIMEWRRTGKLPE